MKFEVNLDQCMNHGQCTFAAPDYFALDDTGQLSLRQRAEHIYTSDALPEDQEDNIEEAIDTCPVQAIRMLALDNAG